MDASIIIPTLASEARAPYLFRALQSLNAQHGEPVVPIVVVNGSVFSQPIVDSLKRASNVRFLYREEGCAPRAVAAGRAVVDTEFFGVLDDDDILLPDSVAIRAAALHNDRRLDAVVTNGYDRRADGDFLKIDNLLPIALDPASFLMSYNWLPSAAGLFRTDTVGPEFFEDAPPVVEWTYIALRLALTRQIRFLDVPTFVIDVDTPGSVSKSRRYLAEQPGAIAKMMALGAPRWVQGQLRRKYVSALHQLSVQYRNDGDYRAAWKAHIASLCFWRGLQYLGYSRHLISPRAFRAPALAGTSSQ